MSTWPRDRNEARHYVNIETFITGSAYFLMNNRMDDLRHFVPRSTNKDGSIALRPRWELRNGIWLLRNNPQVYGAFDIANRAATVAIAGPNWRTFLFVKWLAQYLEKPPAIYGRYRHRWKMTYLQSTEPLDALVSMD